MAYQTIPLTTEQNQEFFSTLLIGEENKTFKLELNWNKTGLYWIMRISDPSTNETLVDSIPLVTGMLGDSMNLLKKYEYLGIGKAYLVPVQRIYGDRPTLDSLGSEFVLVWEG